jgi:hypothetical protein
MKIEVDGQDILVNEISYGDHLELTGTYRDVYKSVFEKKIKIPSNRDFMKLLRHTSEIAFDDIPKQFQNKYDKSKHEIILVHIMMEYLGLSESAKKEDGG